MIGSILPGDLSFIKKVVVLEELGSTNDHALALEKRGEPSGTLVVARKQTAGRGRLKRVWTMGEGDIAATLLLRAPRLPKDNLSLLPWLPALSTVETLQELNIIAKLKWPNDIMIESGTAINYPYFGTYLKIGGVLVENIFKEHTVAASVMGFGLNVRPNPRLKDQVPHAGWLSMIRPEISSVHIWPLLVKKLDENLGRLLAPQGGFHVRARYVRHCATIGKSVRVMMGEQFITGQAVGLNGEGFLIINDGIKEHTVHAGDVSYCG